MNNRIMISTRKVEARTTLKDQAIAIIRDTVWPGEFSRLKQQLPKSILKELDWVGGASIMTKRYTWILVE